MTETCVISLFKSLAIWKSWHSIISAQGFCKFFLKFYRSNATSLQETFFFVTKPRQHWHSQHPILKDRNKFFFYILKCFIKFNQFQKFDFALKKKKKKEKKTIRYSSQLSSPGGQIILIYKLNIGIIENPIRLTSNSKIYTQNNTYGSEYFMLTFWGTYFQ